MSTFEMDARYKGAYEAKRETAKLMKMEKCDNKFIMRITGLSEEEIEKLGIENRGIGTLPYRTPPHYADSPFTPMGMNRLPLRV